MNLPSRRYVGAYMIGTLFIVLAFALWMAGCTSQTAYWDGIAKTVQERK